MKRLIYQVCLGEQKNSRLYKHCIESVKQYCYNYNIEHIVQGEPILKIKPDVFSTNRSPESYGKHGGFLPIYEKENAFTFLDQYDQIAIIDADIYIRPDAQNVFEEMDSSFAFGAVAEREMDCQDWYVQKINNYSHMQYNALHSDKLNFKPNQRGYEFFNMGMIVINSQMFKPYLKGQDPYNFLMRYEFKDFIDGKNAWKWSTDQTLLNYFLKKYNVPVKHISPRFNGLFTAVNNIKECNFVHFFLKDKLPERGESVEELMRQI